MNSLVMRINSRSSLLDIGARLALWFSVLGFVLCLAWPLLSILQKSLQSRHGDFVGLDNLFAIFSQPRIWQALANSVWLALLTLACVLPLALIAAFALTRSRVPARAALRTALLLPLAAPSLTSAISLVYLFGNQGFLKSWLGSHSIYGPLGIVLGEIFYTFPHALLILSAALSVADARLYEAAEVLGAGKFKRFMTVTLPGLRYGLLSSAMLVVTLVVTDFGVPKVIGGQTQVLALEAYKQVIGQQDFGKGAVIGLMLLLPALLSFTLERKIAGRQGLVINARSQVYRAPRNVVRDIVLTLACAAIILFLLALLGVGIAAAFIKLWPYQMNLTLAHFNFEDTDGGGWFAFYNSVKLALATAVIGTIIVTGIAVLTEKIARDSLASTLIRTMSWWPMAIPGLVLGLGYIFCFNAPAHPLHFLYGSMSLMVIATIIHFYTTAHLTMTTSLRKLDPEFEAVGKSLGRSWLTTMWRVTLPLCVPAMLDIFRYLFVSAMTTVSCVIFLYTPDTVLASVAVLNMDDAGDTAAAAAMASLIVLSSFAATLLMNGLGVLLRRRTQQWQQSRN